MAVSKEIVHLLYNDLAKNNGEEMADIKEVLLKVFHKLADITDEVPLINRLVNYIYFISYTNQLQFSAEQNQLIKQLAQIGGKAGLNGVYRADYGDKSQFD
ncbi:hypothetical protein M2139_001810 [Enterococcus sp. PF1-24]|uniref:bacteriocin immunity protein n=1 Tax=unclassified Enterococcus TaxID=2608891 RepID=UPI002475A87D|nr:MULTISPECIES: bacteriocin immunity protein [unclassified Enterococcus]MDH6364866.1 hypothetical protein [Enterococcus sp. PFB1-1]MDH6401910.1 hypothetical protein [Enterococcus sp. PF1-24]